MITNIYLPGCRRIGIQGGHLHRPRRRAVVGSIWAGGIGIGACQELDPIADRGPAVFGIPCSRRSDSITWRGHARRRCTYPESRRRWRVDGLPGRHIHPRGQPWDACGIQVERQPITPCHPPPSPPTRVGGDPCNTRQRTCVSTGRTYECVGGGRKVG